MPSSRNCRTVVALASSELSGSRSPSQISKRAPLCKNVFFFAVGDDSSSSAGSASSTPWKLTAARMSPPARARSSTARPPRHQPTAAQRAPSTRASALRTRSAASILPCSRERSALSASIFGRANCASQPAPFESPNRSQIRHTYPLDASADARQSIKRSRGPEPACTRITPGREPLAVASTTSVPCRASSRCAYGTCSNRSSAPR
mmetsp:Transcript_37260/g.92747  ORF Transcript_37260/g.92747 Transcript_37260/m.92747 type:complete len:206 (+) Transcript_37260:222-839(+)